MTSPRNYLTNPREADLAERIWALTLSLTPSGYEMAGIHEFFASLPWTNRRMFLARDWTTAMRERESDGGVRLINQQFGSAFTEPEIGNVEHFYVSACMACLVPNHPLWFGMMAYASAFWEVVVGPTRIAWLKRERPAREIFAFVKRNLQHNYDQLSNADAAGLTFGSFASLADGLEYLKNEFGPEPAAPPAAAPETVTVGPGDSLSIIAGRKYQDVLLWPVIWDANLTVIGSNPNQTKTGQVLVIPSIVGMTDSDRQKYHARGRDWRSFNK